MIRATLLREWREGWRDRRLPLFLATLFLLFAAATATTALETWRADRGRVAAEQAERARWLAQGERWAHQAARYGIYVFRPAPPLAVADPGIIPYVGGAVLLESLAWNDPVLRPAEDATFVERFGPLSPANVLLVALPLLLVLFGHGIVAREREIGTWPMALSQGIRPGALLADKVLSLWLATAAVLIPAGAVIAGLAAIRAGYFDGPSTSLPPGDALGRGALWLLLALVWALIWSAVTVLVSATVTRRAAALGSLLVLWACLCLLLPRAVATIAEVAAPIPSQQGLQTELLRELANGDLGVDLAARRRALLQRYGVQRVEDLPVNPEAVEFQAAEDRADAVFARDRRGLFDAFERQQTFSQWLSFLSPWTGAHLLSQAVAGSDIHHQRDFVFAAETQRRAIQELLNRELALHPDRDGKRHLSNVGLWARVPEWTWTDGPVAAALSRVWPAAAALAGWLVLLFLALRRVASREIVR